MNATTQAIQTLNDGFRRSLFVGGRLVVTDHVALLPELRKIKVLKAVREFSNFHGDNDPYGEHDFGAVVVDGERYYWKIDYYAPDMMHGSENPADPRVTRRVLTIMHASEY